MGSGAGPGRSVSHTAVALWSPSHHAVSCDLRDCHLDPGNQTWQGLQDTTEQWQRARALQRVSEAQMPALPNSVANVQLCVRACMCVCVCVRACVRAHSVVSDSLQPHGVQPVRLLCPWDSPGKSTGVGCHFLLQGIFLTQGWNHVSCGSCIGRQILNH